MVIDVLTFGEIMAVLRPVEIGPYRPGMQLRLGWAGAEGNVAVGLARAGYSVAWCGRLGDDSLGDMIVTSLRGEGVDVSHVVRDSLEPTGLLWHEERISGERHVSYYRKGLAASRLGPDDLPTSLIREAKLLHITGITPALSESARSTWLDAARFAKECGVEVSLNLNYRSKLWPKDEARDCVRQVLPYVDCLFLSSDECSLLGIDAASADLVSAAADLAVKEVVVTSGAKGAASAVAGDRYQQAAYPVVAVDPVGAGDGFVAGYLSARQQGQPPEVRLATGAFYGARVAASSGDWEGLPTLRDLSMTNSEDVRR